MKSKIIKFGEIDEEYELAGVLDVSILSSIVMLAKNGASLETIKKIKCDITSIQSALWSLINLAAEHAEGKNNMEETFLIMLNQLNQSVKDFTEQVHTVKNFKISNFSKEMH